MADNIATGRFTEEQRQAALKKRDSELQAARNEAAAKAREEEAKKRGPYIEHAISVACEQVRATQALAAAEADKAHEKALHRAHAHGYHAGAWQVGLPLMLIGLVAGVVSSFISVDKATDAGARSAREMAITGAIVSGNREP